MAFTVPREPEKICLNCYYWSANKWQRENAENYNSDFECRRNSPQVRENKADRGVRNRRFPCTGYKDWCGEFKISIEAAELFWVEYQKEIERAKEEENQ